MASLQERSTVRARTARPRSQPETTGWKAKLAAAREALGRYAAGRVLLSVARGFVKDRVTASAAAMTYYGIFSLFPLILLFMSLAGLALQSNEAAREQIMDVVVGLLPQGEDRLKDVIAGVIDAKGAAAGIGLLTLLWSALGWFQVIDVNINQVWGVTKPRAFVKGKLFALAMVAAIGGVALASWAATAAVGILAAFTDLIPGSVLLWQLAVSLLSVLTIAGAFFVLYRFTPRRRVEAADIWPAALATAVLWEIVRRLLALYLEQNNMISGYGPVGAAMALLFWIYVASVIILLGAELAYAIAKERRRIGPDEELRVAAPEGEQPTPKFAPQVGGGFDDPNEQEPILAAPGPPDGRTAASAQAAGGPAVRAEWPAHVPSTASHSAVNGGPIKTLLWTGLTAGTIALGGLLARRISAGVWQAIMHESPPTSKV